jgi:hypothetical protein
MKAQLVKSLLGMNRQDAKDAKREEKKSFCFAFLGALGVLAVLKSGLLRWGAGDWG